MSGADAAKRIPKSLGTEPTLLGTYSLTDLAVALFPGVAVVLLTQVLLPRSLTLAGIAIQTLTLPLAGIAIGVGALFVYLTPTHISSLEWATTALAFRGRTRETDHEASRAVPRLERVDTDADLFERTDGALVGVLRVTPPSMALATDDAWTRAAASFAEFCNTVVEFPIQVYATTRAFPVEAYLDGYRARLDDPDVRANPRLAALIEAYVAWYAADLDARRMTIRDHYVIVPITPVEVQFQRDSLVRQLARLPLVGAVVRAVTRPPEAAVRQALVRGLEDRRSRVEAGLREVEGCTATRVRATEAATLVRAFWAGEPQTDETATAAMFRRTPVVTGPDNRTTQQAQRPTAVQTGDTWTRGLWIGEYPDAPPDGLLEPLYAAPESRRTDLAIHLTPRDTQRTLDALENKLEDLEADHDYLTEKRRAGARGTRKDLDDYREVYDALRNTSTQAFDVAMYAAVRGDDREILDSATDAVTGLARRAPANLTPITPRWTQRDTLVSASPIGVDALGETLATTTPMLGRAVGALFPFVAGSFAEDGIEYGTYALNESPLILDRFARETGYCTMVIGKLGAGKSFATKLHLVRRAMYDPETIIVLMDPLEGFAGVNDALGGERITVGGTRGFNPLDLQPTPKDVLLAAPDIDPWSEQIAWVLTFFETFFTHVATNPLGERRQTLRRAVQEAYERQGITRDPATHTNASPTVRGLLAVLETMLESPAAFGYPTDGERESVQADAQSLLKDLRPSFREGGDLANLAKPTAFDLDASVIYLDLHQEEGTRGRSETSLMMQVLFNAVYERAKGTDKRVIFCIDEAHYLLGDATALGFLETAVRHSRHYDLSVQFITQTGGEFTLTPEARTIASLCSMTLIHRVDEAASELAEWFGLSDREVNWVRTATAGNDADGYSEALLGIDEEGWFPLRVRASPYEAAVISGETPGLDERTATRSGVTDAGEFLDATEK